MKDQEIWMDIPGYEGVYQVSSLGRVKSIERKVRNTNCSFRTVKEKILKNHISNNGYYKVNLMKDNVSKSFTVHHLVSLCFLEKTNSNEKLVVDHIDNNKLNNNINNLQIITNRLNSSKDKNKLMNTSIFVGVCWAEQSGKWKAGIRINKKIIHIGYSNCEMTAKRMYDLALINKDLYNGNNKDFRFLIRNKMINF
jgi:hypothetical protein